MADFGFLSDTDTDIDESAVEEVISQAQDLCVLEQLSAINCSAFTHSVLPSDLDSRFQRLKSFPVPVSATVTHSIPDKHSKPKPPPSPLPYVSDSCPQSQNALFSPSVPQNRPSSNSSSFASPLPLDSSPPQKAGCFWCSPKRLSKKNNKENEEKLGDSDEFLSDLGTFSVKEQKKVLNRAIKEQEKISREAEKIVNWAKQASARMAFPGPEDELSHSDNEPAK